MNKQELEQRTKYFSLRLIDFVGKLPKNKSADVLGTQVLRSGTSIGANYREANRAESGRDFAHKLGIIEKEAAETQYWLELLAESCLGDAIDLRWLLQESSELLAIFTAAARTTKMRRNG